MKLIDNPAKALECARSMANERGMATYIYRARDNKMRVSRSKLNRPLIEKVKPGAPSLPRQLLQLYRREYAQAMADERDEPQAKSNQITDDDAELIYQLYQSEAPKREQVAKIEKEIRELMASVEALRERKRGIKLLSMRDIAKKFDVSESSISRAINKMGGKQ